MTELFLFKLFLEKNTLEKEVGTRVDLNSSQSAIASYCVCFFTK